MIQIKNVYYFRHQKAGFLLQWPFGTPPTQKQFKAVEALMIKDHGTHHPKTKQVYTLTVEHFPLLGNDWMPPELKTDTSTEQRVEVAAVGVQGEGSVSNPK